MTRPLAVVDTADPLQCRAALREALSGDGPAVLFRGGGVNPVHTAPLEVEQRIAVVVETSGTTGRPKRVALSADAVLASAAASQSALGGPGQWLLALPVQYIAGINVLARSLAADVEPVPVPPGRMSGARVLAAIEQMSQPTRFTALVPAQLARLVDDAEMDAPLREALAGFSRILVGGQATPAPLVERATALGWRITRTYGSSENERRLRVRRPAHRPDPREGRRRPRRARGPHDRRVLPGRPGAHGEAASSRTTGSAGTAPTTPVSWPTTARCGCSAALTTRSCRAV
ncbi:MAG: AMP-binding protein [Microcella pacifica]